MIGAFVSLLQETVPPAVAFSVGVTQTAEWTPGHTVAVVVAAIGAVASLLSVGIANRARQHSRAARVQVENEHVDDAGNVINLRDNIDENRDENRAIGKLTLAQLAQLQISLNGVKSDVRGLRVDIGRLYDHDDEIRRDIRNLEQTQNPWERPAPGPSSRRARRQEREATQWQAPNLLGDPSGPEQTDSPGSTS